MTALATPYSLISQLAAAKAALSSASASAQALRKLAVAKATMKAAVTDNRFIGRSFVCTRPQLPAPIGVHPNGRTGLTIGFPDGAA